MSIRAAGALLVVVAVAGAGIVALASRAPASVRARPDEPRATDPSLGARFSAAQVARAAAYNGPRYLAVAVSVVLEIVALVVVATGPWAAGVARLARVPGGWAVHAAIGAVALVALVTVVALPLSYVRGFVMQHAWHLSTQGLGGWLADWARSLGVATVTSAIGAVAFFGVVRWQPRAWWLWGWAAFTVLTAIFVLLWPVVVAPLFNKFTPLRDQALAARATELAHAAGVAVDEVLVADASRRTSAQNAYVAGIGGTRRLVVYDTLLEDGDRDATLFVVAHELGHEVEDHVVKGVALSSVGLFVGFAALAWVSRRPALWAWAAPAGVGDLRALPLLMLFVAVMSLVALPVENAVSRAFEGRADAIAVELTEDPAAATRVLRRLALANVADLRPPTAAVVLLYGHPPIRERIQAVRAASGARP